MATTEPEPKSKEKQTEDDADALYDAVAKRSKGDNGGQSRVFHQDDLLGVLGQTLGSQDPKTLMPLIQWLSNRGLFRTVKLNGKLGWNVRPRAAARQIVTLDRDEKMIYEVIEEAHVSGIWSKEIRKKTGLPQPALTKSLNKMEKNLLIKNVKAVKTPAQKTYMLHHLQPSEEVTGNSFYDAGDLDESFREQLLNLIVFYVRGQSWGESSRKKKHNAISPTLVANDLDSANKKRKRSEDIEDIARPAKHRSLDFDPDTDFSQLVFKAGTHDYPSAENILAWIQTSGVVKPIKASSLTVQEIQGCLDVLCWDDRLEKMPVKDSLVWGYRTVRGVHHEQPHAETQSIYHPGPGLTQAPCGRCPVFDLCHEGGPVNPQECSYFDKWLEQH